MFYADIGRKRGDGGMEEGVGNFVRSGVGSLGGFYGEGND